MEASEIFLPALNRAEHVMEAECVLCKVDTSFLDFLIREAVRVANLITILFILAVSFDFELFYSFHEKYNKIFRQSPNF